MSRYRYAVIAVLFMLLAGPRLACSQLASANLHVNHIEKCVYEVILPKPYDDHTRYEKPLPMDQLPFQIRNDKYVPIGTAFAISSTEFATAAHVMNLRAKSYCKEVFIRDMKGHVFAIDKIVKFSSRRDFVVFTVKKRNCPDYFATNSTPRIGDKVFAVGDALGEGVAIRDGLYTSSTPEEIDGKWSWIRFSAAASPGNSGGPLLDQNGKVIGIVLLKSKNENLNCALPISEVEKDDGKFADIFLKTLNSLELFDFVKRGSVDKKIGLPLSYDDLKKAYVETVNNLAAKMRNELLTEHKADIFPNGSGSDDVIYGGSAGFFPRLIMRGESGIWEPREPSNIKRVALDNNGSIYYGVLGRSVFARIEKPDNVSLHDLYFNSKSFMELMLKALYVHRSIGSEKIRIISLGKADNEYTYTDDFGRKWLVRTWPRTYCDNEIAAFILPLPNGCAVIIKDGQSGKVLDDLIDDMKIVANFVNVSYSGTSKEWREYLSNKDILPSVFDYINLQIDAKSIEYKSQDYSVRCNRDNINLSDSSIIEIDFGYRKLQDDVKWHVKEVMITEGKYDNTGFLIGAMVKPDKNNEKLYAFWRKAIEGRKPFDKKISIENDTTSIWTVADRPAGNGMQSAHPVIYFLDCMKAGNISQAEMESGLNGFLKQVHFNSK